MKYNTDEGLFSRVRSNGRLQDWGVQTESRASHQNPVHIDSAYLRILLARASLAN